MDRNALYEKTMDRIKAQPKEDRDWAIRILTWVCRAGRALTIDELQVAIQPEPFSGGILNDSSKLSNEDILEFCGGLISINTHTNSVVFFHDTVREYFSQNSSKHFPEAHDMIVSRCTIRLATAFSAMISRTTRENSDRSRDLQGYGIWSLLEDCRVLTTFEDYGLDAYEDYESQSVFAYYQLTRYSLEFLGHHVREAEEILTSTLGSVRRPSDAHTQPASVCDKIPLSQKTYQRVYDLISESKSRELLVRLLVYDGQYAGSYRMTEKPRKPTAIHVASSLGLYRTTVSLLDTSGSSTVNDRDSNDETAVMIAMRKNYSYLVTLFVQRGADVDLRTKIGREVLLYAAGRGLILIADNIIAQAYNRTKKRKLARKLEFSSRAPDASVLLLCAAYHDDCTTVTRLLRSSKFIRIASKDGVLGVCLLLAAQKRRHSIVRTLLDKGVDIDSRDATGRTALHRAADWNDKDLVEMLLKYNADVDIKDNKLETAWSSICGNEGHAEVEAILVKAKTDVNTKGEDGVSALYLAAAGGHTTIVRRLLRSGTDPNIATLYGWCPLVSMLLTLPSETFLTVSSTGLLEMGTTTVPSSCYSLEPYQTPCLTQV
jgi:ankyrin repeat protein